MDLTHNGIYVPNGAVTCHNVTLGGIFERKGYIYAGFIALGQKNWEEHTPAICLYSKDDIFLKRLPDRAEM